MKLTGKRKIDETPAALHDAMETFGGEKLARAEKVVDWSEPADFPRPQTFDEGKDVIESILALSNPIHRVKEIHARAEELKAGVEMIDQVGAFREKWGVAYTELRTFATQLRAVEHLLAPEGDAGRFLADYQTARAGARFAETDVWKQIQGTKACANLEVQTLLEQWRGEARQMIQDALDRLPEDLQRQNLDEDLAKELAAPLDSFAAALDSETDPARAAALPARARRLVDALAAAIHHEVQKLSFRPSTVGSPQLPPPRETRHLRLSDVAAVRRIKTESEWEALAKKLDDRMRALLKEYEVELD